MVFSNLSKSRLPLVPKLVTRFPVGLMQITEFEAELGVLFFVVKSKFPFPSSVVFLKKRLCTYIWSRITSPLFPKEVSIMPLELNLTIFEL